MNKTVDQKKMKNCDDCSSFNPLPDEMVFQILNKLLDLKTVCLCKLISKRFHRIILQVDTITFTIPPGGNPSFDPNRSSEPLYFECKSYKSVLVSLLSFKGLKSLRIEVPSTLECVDSPYLFKWKINFGNIADSFVFLSPNFICDTKENYHEEDEEDVEDTMFPWKKLDIAHHCLTDANVRCAMLLAVICHFPLLKDVSITDLRKRGKVSLSAGNINEISEWLSWRLTQADPFHWLSQCYVPLLKLPVSRYVMKGVNLLLWDKSDKPEELYDTLMKSDDPFEDEEEAAYCEAMKDIFKKHRGLIKRYDLKD